MEQTDIRYAVESGRTYLGIELGFTRIKGVLIDPDYHPAAFGDFAWENQYIDSIWTYTLEDVWKGVQACYSSLVQNVRDQYGVTLTRIGAIGISGMMHGYLPFDKNGELLMPFRTWRNTITGQAADELTEILQFNIPQRWSIAHLYQAILNKEEHVNDIAYLTIPAGEGGAWGMALLAAFMAEKGKGETLENYLEEKVYVGQRAAVLEPVPEDQAGFAEFIRRYRNGLVLERYAAEHI